MESQLQAHVIDVASRQATRKSDGAKFTLYDIRLSDGETYTTSRREVAEQAHAFTGQQIIATVKVEQNGVYTNRYLNAVQGTGFGAPGVTPPPAPAFAPAAAPAPAPGIPDVTGANDDKIYRQVAAKVAASLSTTESEFWGNVDNLVHYFRTGEKPIAGGSFSSTPPPTDDIPF